MLVSSRYNVLHDYPDVGFSMLFNTLYGSVSMIEPAQLAHVKSILAAPASAEDKEQLKLLLQQKHIIEDSVDELAIMNNRRLAGMRDPNRLDLNILPTLNCNFACTYCFETHKASKMDAVTEAAIKLWLENTVPGHKVLSVHWFGGEPLLCPDVITSIASHALRVCAENGVAYTSFITTNGYLLKPDMAKELMRLGITDYQITLDGAPDTHDKLRKLKNGNGTFDRIFTNITSLLRNHRKANVVLRMNLNSVSLESIAVLLRMFPQELRHRIVVRFEPVFENHEKTTPYYACGNVAPPELATAAIGYFSLAEELGYNGKLNQAFLGRLMHCNAEKEHQAFINYNGDVFKCAVSDFDSEKRVGYIREDGLFVINQVEWDKWVNFDDIPEECAECVYLPSCCGGCKALHIMKMESGEARPFQVSCELTVEYIRQNLRDIGLSMQKEVVI